jgi:hypothetical protein
MGGSENMPSAILALASGHVIVHWLVVTEFGISDLLELANTLERGANRFAASEFEVETR